MKEGIKMNKFKIINETELQNIIAYDIGYATRKIVRLAIDIVKLRKK